MDIFKMSKTGICIFFLFQKNAQKDILFLILKEHFVNVEN
jgi:hypothetical protein